MASSKLSTILITLIGDFFELKPKKSNIQIREEVDPADVSWKDIKPDRSYQ